MTDCPLQLVDPRKPGHYVCPLCGWKYRGPKPARRNCPELKPDRQTDVRRLVLLQIHAWIQSGAVDRMAGEIEAQLDHCLNDCRHFNGAVCTYRGSVCRCWQRWLETLALRRCEQWKESPTS